MGNAPPPRILDRVGFDGSACDVSPDRTRFLILQPPDLARRSSWS